MCMHNLFSFRPGYDEPMKNLARLERNLQRVTLFLNDGVLFFQQDLERTNTKEADQSLHGVPPENQRPEKRQE